MASSVHFLLLLFLSLTVLLTPTTVQSVQVPSQKQHPQLLQDGTYPPPQAPSGYKPPALPVAEPLTPPAKPYTSPPTPTPATKPPAPPVKPYTPPPKAPTAPIATPPAPYHQPVKKEECGPLCDARCSLHSRKQVCVRACSTCCLRCKCVPPGTYGNRELCGKCYTDMLTHGYRFKCP